MLQYLIMMSYDTELMRHNIAVRVIDHGQVFTHTVAHIGYIQDAELFTKALRAMYEAIEDQPVIERPRSEWEEIERGGLLNHYVVYRCKLCGNTFKVYQDTLNAGRGDKNYCVNCGADMREENT